MASFWKFQQNNSGGSFNEEFGYCVYVEAASPEAANNQVGRTGIYFDGCECGIDCPCCGDRWYLVSGMADAKDVVELKDEVLKSLEYADHWKLGVGVVFLNQPLLLVHGVTDVALLSSDSIP